MDDAGKLTMPLAKQTDAESAAGERVPWATWLQQQRSRLSAQPLTGYDIGERPSAEPVALAALAAITHAWSTPAAAACEHLRRSQLPDGSVGVWLDDRGPFWTTSLACLAWQRFRIAWPEQSIADEMRHAEERAVEYLLTTRGEPIELSESVGHNTQLVGWPWVQGTHSWVEPTSFAVMALRHAGLEHHPRTVEACELLVDRWLPSGGANYGNTFVLGQQLRPHVLPSATSVLALHGRPSASPQLSMTVNYLRDELGRHRLGTISLAWSVLALVGSLPTDAIRPSVERTLSEAIARTQGTNAYRQNMLIMAMGLSNSPLLDFPEHSTFNRHSMFNREDGR